MASLEPTMRDVTLDKPFSLAMWKYVSRDILFNMDNISGGHFGVCDLHDFVDSRSNPAGNLYPYSSRDSPVPIPQEEPQSWRFRVFKMRG